MQPISICVIMKNEERHIETFLSSIENAFSSYPHEIVLVDTGSTDKTVSLCSKYDVKLFSFAWINDFSAARNFSIMNASNNHILVLDVDEFVEEVDFQALESWACNHDDTLGMIRINNVSSEGEIHADNVSRVFNRNFYHFEGIVHEQLVRLNSNIFSEENRNQAKDNREINTHEKRIILPLTVKHVGYAGSKEEMCLKAKRNIDLLLNVKDWEKDPYILYQIGQSYYAIKEYDRACEYFSQALSFDIDEKLDYVRMMVVSYGYALLELNRTEEALGFTNVYDAFSDYPEFVLMMGSVFLKAGLLEEAVDQFFKAMDFKDAKTEGVTTYIPLYNLGCINEVLGNLEDARELYLKCGNYKPAKERLSKL